MPLSRPFHFVGIGQSFWQEGYALSSSYWAFATALMRVFATDAATILDKTSLTVDASSGLQRRNLAVGGSAILQANAGSSNPSNYWVKNDGTSGPLLDAAVSAIGGYGTKPFCIGYSHGQQDVGYFSSEADSLTAKNAIANRIWPDVRAAISVPNANNVPIFVDVPGPRFRAQEFAEYWMRDRIIELISDSTNNRVYRGCETYCLPFDASTHPSDELGYLIQGAHAGRKVAHFLVHKDDTADDGALRGPYISSASIEGVSVRVDITVPAGKTLVKPARPDYFGLFDANDNRLNITGYQWSDSAARLYMQCAGTPAKLRYPCPTGRPVNFNNIVRLSSPSDPIFPGEPGLVLESAKTITL